MTGLPFTSSTVRTTLRIRRPKGMGMLGKTKAWVSTGTWRRARTGVRCLRAGMRSLGQGSLAVRRATVRLMPEAGVPMREEAAARTGADERLQLAARHRRHRRRRHAPQVCRSPSMAPHLPPFLLTLYGCTRGRTRNACVTA